MRRNLTGTRVKIVQCLALVALLGAVVGCHASSNSPPTGTGLESAHQALQRGDYESAATALDQVVQARREARDVHGQAEALAALGSAQIQLGRYDLAAASLREALATLQQAPDASRARVLNLLGVALTFGTRGWDRMTLDSRSDAHHHGEAAPSSTAASSTTAPCHDPARAPQDHTAGTALSEALALARAAGDPALEASILNNLANLHVRGGRVDEAKTCYDAAAKLVETGDLPTRARLLVNSASCELSAAEAAEPADRAPLVQRATEQNQLGQAAAMQLHDSHDKAFLLLTVGQTAEQTAVLSAEKAADLQRFARSAYQHANDIATRLGDQRSRCYASGYLGAMALADNDLDSAQALTRTALTCAQQARLPDALYRWQWQLARINRQRFERSHRVADLDASIRFYEAAAQSVQFIRNDIALGHGNQRKHQSFREAIGALFFEHADMILRRAELVEADDKSDAQARAAAAAALYVQARDTVERVKAVELENYFRDECVNLVKARRKGIEDAAAFEKTAVVYLIPLADRTEILVSFGGAQQKIQFVRIKADLTEAALQSAVAAMRAGLLNGDDFREYREPGELLYEKLIAPIEPHLAARGILPAKPGSDAPEGTLVFVPDGALRTIPMAALFDRRTHQHLVEKYAIAVTPGLDLMEPRKLRRTDVSLLLNGLSEGKEGFPPLLFVPEELQSVQSLFAGKRSDKLVDEGFTRGNLQQRLRASEYSIVHIASHAYFGAEASQSKLLTHDVDLGLNDVEALIRPYQLRDKPVELLMLSACQTAEGNEERAALGLAGIAIKAGARSAVATLWSVNDRATSILVREFYRQLASNPALSKAQALARAQRAVLEDPQLKRFRHAHYWAPFIVIGNWL